MHRGMRYLVGFFGITRSLPHTIGSIRTHVLAPLRASGIAVATAGHFNLPGTWTNPRSGEVGITPDRCDAALLDLDVCQVEPQSDAMIADELAAIRAVPDPYGDGYRSLTNLCHQLRSLNQLWSLLRLFGPGPGDLVLLLRPDLLYLDRLEPARDLGLLTAGKADLIVPAWQSWGGLNDRFAFCTVRTARAYATRLRLLSEACQVLGGMHPEIFLRVIAAWHGMRVGLTELRAVRVRGDGRVAPNDRSMLSAAADVVA